MRRCRGSRPGDPGNPFPCNRLSGCSTWNIRVGVGSLRGEPPPGPGPGLIREVLAEAGITVSAMEAERLSVHAAEMLRWNRSIRLTAITDPVEVAAKHVADSLLPLRFAPFPGRLLDFGSGAGYPGIPLAICLPGTRVTLVDASAKKCAFLSRVRGLLGLPNVAVVHGRVGKGPRLPIGPFDHIVTRATAPPQETVTLLAPYLAPGGRFLFLLGPSARARHVAGIPEAVTRREPFRLPRGMGDREILEIEPAG
ncbi:MAG: methyltransferase GidB [Deltaproteobacteria bacterium]|nr:methyltransferase GidB [Deltaproteobacteria bacterium]